MKKLKGLRKKNLIDNSVVIMKEKWRWGEAGEGKGGINGDGKRHDLGW